MRTLQKIVLVAATAVCVILRVLLKLNGIDPETGFYLEGYEMLSAVFSICLAAGVVLLIAIGFLDKHEYASDLPLEGALPRVLCFLAAVPAFWMGAESIYNAFFAGGAEAAAAELFAVRLRAVLYALPPVLSAFFFVRCGLIRAGGKRPGGFFSLLPMLWQVIVLLALFMQYTAVRSVSDQMCVILTLVFCVLFLPGFGRIYSDTGAGQGAVLVNRYGPAFILLTLSTCAGIVAAALTGKAVQVAMPVTNTLFYLVLACLALVLFLFLRPVQSQPDITRPVADTPDMEN